MLKPIKLSLRKYLFNKELQQRRRKVRLITLERAATIGILYNLFTEDDFKVMSRFIKKLQEQGKKVKAIAYNGGKIVPPFYNETLTQDLILEKQLTRLSFPKVPFVSEFIESQFDILFDFSMEHNFPVFYLGALSSAGFKIGLNEDNRVPYFDLVITPESNSSLEKHIESTLLYLEQIKPVIQ